MQNWEKIGLIIEPKVHFSNEWMSNYAAVPFIDEEISGSILKIYFSSRTKENKSLTGWAEFDINNLTKGPLKLSTKPLIDIGKVGMFDEDGVMGCHITNINNKRFFYYIGWNIGKSVPFRNSIGLAIADSDSDKFQRFSNGPIIDRGIHDNCFVASNCIFKEDNFYRMYYLSCNEWKLTNSTKLSHKYNIKYAESSDGINWNRNGIVAIDFKYENEYAISVPRVIKENDIYKMWYSYRGGLISNYYTIGYAESRDGKEWIRKDDSISFIGDDLSWDSQMKCYPFIFDYKNERYMLYNGNEYGKTGVGLAVLKK